MDLLPALDLPGLLNTGNHPARSEQIRHGHLVLLAGRPLVCEVDRAERAPDGAYAGSSTAIQRELVAEGREPNTVRLREAALRRFCRWLVVEGELPADPLLGLKPPKKHVYRRGRRMSVVTGWLNDILGTAATGPRPSTGTSRIALSVEARNPTYI